jgi:adenylosuccinate synthase
VRRLRRRRRALRRGAGQPERLPPREADLEYFPGWQDDISGARTFEDLPKKAQDYVLALEAMSGTRISVIGVGPARDAVIVRHDLVD